MKIEVTRDHYSKMGHFGPPPPHIKAKTLISNHAAVELQQIEQENHKVYVHQINEQCTVFVYPRYPVIRIFEKSGIHSSLHVEERVRKSDKHHLWMPPNSTLI